MQLLVFGHQGLNILVSAVRSRPTPRKKAITVKAMVAFFLYLGFIRLSLMLSSLLIPQHLLPGDTIAAISPSWGGAGDAPFYPRYVAGVQAMEQLLGLHVKEMPYTLKGTNYLYNHVQARVDDLHLAFTDPFVKAVISCVGGDDAIRTINLIDVDLLRENPKIFIGFSDATVIHFACLKAGLRSYYGPHILTNFAETPGPQPYLVDSFRKTLFSTGTIGYIQPGSSWTYEDLNWLMPGDEDSQHPVFPAMPWNFIQGRARVSGRLLGGCADVLPLITGTRVWPSPDVWEKAILFLELSGPAVSPKAFLAILRNLGAQGILGRINGIVFGRLNGIPPEQSAGYEAMLIQATCEFGCPELPIATQMAFGHTSPVFLLPYGATATIDPEARTFSIDEAGCS